MAGTYTFCIGLGSFNGAFTELDWNGFKRFGWIFDGFGLETGMINNNFKRYCTTGILKDWILARQ